jgi:murein DD-endopeptidase MepM/ murein hydrolase activator NlpD
MRFLIAILLLLLAGAGVVYYAAGKAAGPAIVIDQPSVVGQTGTLDVTIDAPGGRLDRIAVSIEQNGETIPVVAWDSASAEPLAPESGDSLHITRPIGRQALPQLRSGSARIVVSATRPVLWGLRHTSSEAARDIQVRLEPPRIAVVSTHHYINIGGAEMVVYRVTPPDVESGVRISDLTFPGCPASGAAAGAAADLKVAFLAIPYNEPQPKPVELYARDAVGNEARALFDYRLFPKKFRSSTIPIDDRFLGKVVPPIREHAADLKMPADDLLAAFLIINGDLRRANNARIGELAKQTAKTMLWRDAFQPLGGSQVESAFADDRTYVYGGKQIDRQTHLGFDLARTVNAPVTAANAGKVIYAADLGVYGNCVILDHGMGVQSLYGHLSSFAVHEGDEVKQGQVLGQSGQTGLAAGDHLHFSMLVNGQFVNATEWWDPHWIQDRIVRKLHDLGS